MAIKWTDDLSINVGAVDVQHKEIFKRYSGFIAACKEGRGREQIVELLDFLTDYVNEHFEHEEKLMKEYTYPDIHTHQKEHAELLQTVQKFKARLAMQGASVSLIAEVNKVLLNWLLEHIRRSDMEMGGYLNKKWGVF
jgi:hemerythrin